MYSKLCVSLAEGGGVKERNHPCLDGNKLKWIFKKSVGRKWTGLIWLRIGTNGGCC